MSNESGANARDVANENTGLFRRPAAPSLTTMPLEAGWVDEAIAMLDDLEDAPPPRPWAEEVETEEIEFEIDIVDDDAVQAMDVQARETTVVTARPVLRTPAPQAQRRPAPLSYVGAVRPFTPARSRWRPGSRSSH